MFQIRRAAQTAHQHAQVIGFQIIGQQAPGVLHPNSPFPFKRFLQEGQPFRFVKQRPLASVANQLHDNRAKHVARAAGYVHMSVGYGVKTSCINGGNIGHFCSSGPCGGLLYYGIIIL